MEILKKTILQAVTTGTTVPCTLRDSKTGNVITCSGYCYTIVPDLNAVYYIMIGLKQVGHDIGFFDTYSYGYGGYGYGNTDDYSDGIGESLLMDDFFI